MWLLIIYVGVRAGIVPITQDFNTQRQCEYVKKHIEETTIPVGIFGTPMQIKKSECVEVPR